MTITTIAGLEKLTTRPEKRLVKALDTATTRIAVLESKPTSRVAEDNISRNELIIRFTRQQNSLTSEVENIIAHKVEREKLDKFEVKEVVVNKKVVVKGFNHDLANSPDGLTDAQTVLNLAKKGYIRLLSVTIKEYEAGSERIARLVEKNPWTAILDMPGSKNNYHIATPTDFMTENQKEAYRQEWIAKEPDRKRERQARHAEIRRADAEYRRGAPARRKEALRKKVEDKVAKRQLKAEQKTRLDARNRAEKSAKLAFNIKNKEALHRKKEALKKAKELKKSQNNSH